MTSFLRSTIKGQSKLSFTSAMDKHGPKPAYLYSQTNHTLDMLDEILYQIKQFSSSERESIALICSTNDVFYEVQQYLYDKQVAFALMGKDSYLYQLHYVLNLLVYPRLILDKQLDEETERLLRYNIVPYFDKAQISKIMQLAGDEGLSLFETISSEKLLTQVTNDPIQRYQLQLHLNISNYSGHLEKGLSKTEKSGKVRA
ncbi:hypothetical protein KDI_53850 [Dictyobacter arantiisoli]|uniref:UvrD-like helicase C-terminal domain-containing protein n=2 Tax=Dictyobacter arantiisoli TaxID=2014874 RepID=A0A5A5TJN2_9CHLR|nr:hypothetical protein KDI_53850 [Dictyobacter arantiisoli]